MNDFNAPYRLLIDGRLVDASARLDVINPATGAVFANCPSAGAAELDAAVAAARRAFPRGRRWDPPRAREYIARFAAALEAHKEPLARLLTQEQGKPVGQSRDEIARAGTLSVGITKIAVASEVILDNAERFIELRYQPLGVAGIITPWNAPVNLAAGPLASALYTGNCAIIKPSPFTPLTTLRIGEILQDILPAGVVNVLAGGDELGGLLTAHPGIDKIAFTGSVATGKKVMASCAATLKRVTLELGGNDAAIVLPDVDVADVAKKLFFAATVNSGQVCMAVKRIYAHESIHDALVAALAAEAGKAKLGDGLDPATTLGPIQNRRQFERVCELKDDARTHGQLEEGQAEACRKRLLRLAHRSHRPRGSRSPGRRGTVRSGVPGTEVHRRGRCHRPRQRHALRPFRIGVEPRHQARRRYRRAPGSRHRVGEPAPHHGG